MSTFDVSLHEPVSAVVTADNLAPTVDSLTPSADGGILVGAADSADAVANANFLFGEIVEPVGRPRTADQLEPTVDTLAVTADGAPSLGAGDTLDAQVIAVPVPAPIFGLWRPAAVSGFAYGVLPELEGEAYGEVVTAGTGVATLRLEGAAIGEHHDDDELLVTLMLTMLDDAA